MRLRASERVLVALLGGVFGISAISWLAVQAASLLSGMGTAGLGILDMAQIVPSAIGNPSDPLVELREQLPEQLPSAALLYAALLLIAGLAIGLVLLVVRLGARGVAGAGGALVAFARRGGPRSRGGAGPLNRGATWGRRGDVRDLIVREPQQGRLTLGFAGRRLLAGEQMHSVLVFGPTGSWKTSAFAIPNILEWNGDVVAASVKNDLLEETLARREQLGRVQVFDPAHVSGLPAAQWTPLGGCEDWDRAQQRAQAMCSVGASNKGEMDFWFNAASKLLGTLLFAAAAGGRDIADVVRWINTQEVDEVDEALVDAPDLAQSAWEAEKNRDSKQRGSIYTTAEAAMRAYNSQAVLDAARRYEIRADEFLGGESAGNTLYLVAPAKQQARMRPLFAGVLEEILEAAYEVALSNGGRLRRPLLVVLDEAANIAPLEELDVIASTARTHDVQLVTMFQDVAQVKNRYGQKAETIINNHRAKLFLSGIADPETLQLVTRITGEEEMLQVTRNRGRRSSDDRSEATAWRSIAPADVVREQRPGHGILVYGHLAPTKVTLRAWFRDRRLRALAAANGAEAA